MRKKPIQGGADSTVNIEKPGFKTTVNPKLSSKSWNLAWCYVIAPTCCGKNLVQFGTCFGTNFLQTGASLKKPHGSERELVTYVCEMTFLITDLFAAYHTHLAILNRFYSLVSTQIVHPSEPHAVYRTHLHLAARFFCSSSSQIVNWVEAYALHRTCN